MDRKERATIDDSPRVVFSWELHAEVQELIFEMGQRLRDQAVALAKQRCTTSDRAQVSRADILAAADQVLPQSLADFERAMSTDQGDHVRKAS